MIRTSLVIMIAAGVAALALAGCAPPVPPAPMRPVTCLPPFGDMVESTVRRALPAATTIACATYTPETAADGKPAERKPAGTPGGSPGGVVNRVEARTALPDGRIAVLDISADGRTVLGITYGRGHTDLVDSSGKGMALLFWAFALASVGGAIFVVSRKNLIAAVMGMVGSFLGIAAIYMMLYAQFLAIVQMLVYAGAIMVLFVFVVMILNRPEDEPVAPSGRAGQVVGGLAILYLVVRLVMMLMHVEPPNAEIANAAPLPTALGYDWGSIGAVGTELFGPGLFPFEAISILLLVAVVGAIAIARPLHAGSDNAGDAPDEPHPEGGAV